VVSLRLYPPSLSLCVVFVVGVVEGKTLFLPKASSILQKNIVLLIKKQSFFGSNSKEKGMPADLILFLRNVPYLKKYIRKVGRMNKLLAPVFLKMK
jgi:hypothetical protein